MSLLCALAAMIANAEETSKPAEIKRIPAHNPEWTNSKGSDPGTTESVVPELQGIVVLCATEPQSAGFKKQWAAYVRGNYKSGMKIDAVIEDVLRRADAYRNRQHSSSQPATTRAAQSSDATRKMMHDTAMTTIKSLKR